MNYYEIATGISPQTMKLNIIQVIKFLFVHRSDVFARHYSAKSIWYPVKTKDKSNFMPLETYNLFNHLNGLHRIGVYSTALDNTVKWIAADFDDNELAFTHCLATYNKLKEHNIFSWMERSNSGKGYHLWIFFTEPVLAKTARRLMLAALQAANVPIKGAMAKGGNTDRSMDRLIPTQNTLPSGGLGNLICLPLHKKAVELGNCVFINEDQIIYPNQIALLYHIAWQGRTDIKSPHVVELYEQIEPLKDDSVEEREWTGINSDDQLDRLQGCEAIKESLENPNKFSNFAWMSILSNLAVFGDKARSVAHDISRGYDMRTVRNNPEATYSEDETDRIFSHKIDFIQKSGTPTTCARLAEEGWECPRINECSYKFIAKYDIDPIDEIKDVDINNKQLYESIGLEDLVATYTTNVLNTDSYLVQYDGNFYKDGAWIHGTLTPYPHITKYEIGKMLLGEHIQIEQFDKNGMTKFCVIEFTGPLQSNHKGWASTVNGIVEEKFNRVVVLFSQKQNVVTATNKLLTSAKQFGLDPLGDGLMIEQWTLAPFIGNIAGLYNL